MELFDGLFDDETLLPDPQALPLAQVVADHQELRATYRSQLASLVVPDTHPRGGSFCRDPVEQ